MYTEEVLWEESEAWAEGDVVHLEAGTVWAEEEALREDAAWVGSEEATAGDGAPVRGGATDEAGAGEVSVDVDVVLVGEVAIGNDSS